MKLRTFIVLCTVVAAALFGSAISCPAADEGSSGIVLREYLRLKEQKPFKAGKDWFPMPSYSDRAAWGVLTAADSATIVRRAEHYLGYKWQVVPATGYLAFERTGDRRAMENPQGENRGALISLMAGELTEGKGRFIDQILNGVWLATEQTSWVLSAHQASQRSKRSLPDAREHFIDLGSARYGAIISLAHHFFKEEFDKIDPSISRAVEQAVKRNILDPYLDIQERKAQFWMGYYSDNLNNWNPWCNADVVLCFLLMEKDQFRLDAALRQSAEIVDRWLDHIKKDGGCEEGPGYWDAAAGKFIDYLQILYDASEGAFNLFSNARIRNMGEFVSRAYIGDGYATNFADASALYSDNGGTIWRYGLAVGSRELMNYALYLRADTDALRFRSPAMNYGDAYRCLQGLRFNAGMEEELFVLQSRLDAVPKENRSAEMNKILSELRRDVPRGTCYPETEVAYMRNSSDWFLGVKGGYNDESHNHNDIGTCIFFVSGMPVLVDAGVGTYTRATFNEKERYKIWSMRSEWHNLPRVNGVSQEFGRQYRAKDFKCDVTRGTASVELSGAYPDSAGIVSWCRTYSMPVNGKPSLQITDKFTLSERNAPDTLNFLVKGEVYLAEDVYICSDGKEYKVRLGELLIVCDNSKEKRPATQKAVIRMGYPLDFQAELSEKELSDRAFTRVWGKSLRRISLISRENAPLKGKYDIRFTQVKL